MNKNSLEEENKFLKQMIRDYYEPTLQELQSICEMYGSSIKDEKISKEKIKIKKAIEMIKLIRPELWNIDNKMTYKLIDIQNVLEDDTDDR